MKRVLLVALLLLTTRTEAQLVTSGNSSPAQLTADQNDYAACDSPASQVFCRLNVDGTLRRITGMAAGRDGQWRILINAATATATDLRHVLLMDESQSSSSSAANRFRLPEGENCLLPPNSGVLLIYDGTSQRWRVPAASGCDTVDYGKVMDLRITPCFTADSNTWDFQTSGTGATLSTFTAAQQDCFIQAVLGTTTTGRGSISTAMNTSYFGGGVWTYRTTIQFPANLSDGTETYTIRMGGIDSVTAESTDGCFFRYNHTLNSGRWQGVCRNNSTESVCDTGVTATVNVFYYVDMVVSTTGSAAGFVINNGTPCSVSTNIPTTSARAFGWGVMALKSAGTTSRTVSFGTQSVRVEGAVPY